MNRKAKFQAALDSLRSPGGGMRLASAGFVAPRKPQTARTFVDSYLVLVERVDRSWFQSRTRREMDDGDRREAMLRRTARAVRLLAFLAFGSGR